MYATRLRAFRQGLSEAVYIERLADVRDRIAESERRIIEQQERFRSGVRAGGRHCSPARFGREHPARAARLSSAPYALGPWVRPEDRFRQSDSVVISRRTNTISGVAAASDPFGRSQRISAG
jgi:hypothetical protein